MIPHNRPFFDEADEAAASAAIRSGWVAQGREVEGLEDEFCRFLGLPAGGAVAVSSGSAALYLALLALGAGGKTVSAPSYSCRALLNAIEFARAKPIWLDVTSGQANADYGSPAAMGADITIVAHLFGIPASFPEGRTDVIIEDGAQALGAELDGRMVGTIGAVGVFSLGATKIVTAGGQGGMLVSRNREIVRFARATRDYDVPVDSHPRFNVQMTDLQAAVGRVQLRRLPFLIERRERIFQRYKRADVELLEPTAPASRPIRYRAVMRADFPSDTCRRFAALGVTTIVPVAEEELLASPQQVPYAAALSRSTLSLPIFPALSDRDVEQVARGLASAE